MMVKLADALKQPVSLVNLGMMIIGGVSLYFAIINRLDRQEQINLQQTRIDAEQTRAIEEGKQTRREEMMRMDAQMRAVEQKADAKLEALARDLSELKGDSREIKANLQWLIRAQGGAPQITIPPLNR